MQRLPFLVYFGAYVGLFGTLLVSLGLFLPLELLGRANASSLPPILFLWLLNVLVSIGQPPSALFLVLLLLSFCGFLLPPLSSLLVLFSRRNRFLSMLVSCFAAAGFLLGLAAIALTVMGTPPSALLVVLGLFVSGLLLSFLGAALQTRRALPGGGVGGQAVVTAARVEAPGSFGNVPKAPKPKYSYFADKASKQQ